MPHPYEMTPEEKAAVWRMNAARGKISQVNERNQQIEIALSGAQKAADTRKRRNARGDQA